MKKYLLILAAVTISLIYGILIGKYEFYPYRILKNIQDNTDERLPIQKKTGDFFQYHYSQSDLENLLSVIPNKIDSIRKELSFKIFGTYTLPEQFPDTIYTIIDKSYNELSNLEKIEQFNIIQKHDIKSIGYIFHPKNSNNELLIYHQGHQGDFIKGKNTIKYFLERGFTIYAFCMPLFGKNNQPMVYREKLGNILFSSHDRLKYLENPIQYFIFPVISMINYAEQKKFNSITMVGLSGGGWTTTLTAAVDSRVNYSFPVAGTYPMFIRFQKPTKNYGDWEQTYPILYSEINYLDMYVMGATGEDRFQMQILNKYDECCFDGDDYKIYADFISSKVKIFKNGSFQVFSDSSHAEHKISQIALTKILDEINSASNRVDGSD